MDGGDNDVFESGLHERYAARPHGNPFYSMTLAHFVVWYASKAPSTSNRAHSRNKLQDNSGCIESKYVSCTHTDSQSYG